MPITAVSRASNFNAADIFEAGLRMGHGLHTKAVSTFDGAITMAGWSACNASFQHIFSLERARACNWH